MTLTLEQAQSRAFAHHFFDHTDNHGDLHCRCGANIGRPRIAGGDYTPEFDVHRAEVALALLTGKVSE